MKPLAALFAGVVAGGLIATTLLLMRPTLEPANAVSTPQSSGNAALADSITKLDERLARIESSLAVQQSRGTREPATPSSVPSTAVPEGLGGIHEDLLQISKRIDLLANSIKENHKPAFSLPTLEQIHAARKDVDWSYLDQLRQAITNDKNSAQERVRQMTFDDLLRKVGLPMVISSEDGAWAYFRYFVDEFGQERQRGVTFRFAGDSVSLVFTYP
jgi:hypothetical protein